MEEQERLIDVEFDNSPLDDFDWDSPQEEQTIELFGEKITIEPDESVKTDKQKPKDKQKDKVDDKDDKDDEDDIELFSENEKLKDKDDNNDDEFNYKSFIEKLNKKDIFSFEIDDDEEIDEDKFLELFDQEVDNRVEETNEEFVEGLGNDGKAFIKFSRNGGTLQQFISMYGGVNTVPNVDLDTVNGQETILKMYYKDIEKLDNDDITAKLEFLEERGKTEYYARKYYDQMKAEEDEAKEEIIEQQKIARKNHQDKIQKFSNDIKNTLNTNNEIQNVPFSKSDKKELIGWITNPTIKLGANHYVTPLHSELSKVLNNPEKVVILAKLLKSNFNFDFIEANLQTKTAKKVKENIDNAKKGNVTKPVSSRSNVIKQTKRLADLFDS